MPPSATLGGLDGICSHSLSLRQRNTAEMRGGSWNNNPQNVRVSNRNRNRPTNRNNNIGFRCAGYAERGPGPAGECRFALWRLREGQLRFRAVDPDARPQVWRQTATAPGFLVANRRASARRIFCSWYVVFIIECGERNQRRNDTSLSASATLADFQGRRKMATSQKRVVPKFASEAEEAAWWDQIRNTISRDLRDAANAGELKVLTKDRLRERLEASKSRVVSIRRGTDIELGRKKAD